MQRKKKKRESLRQPAMQVLFCYDFVLGSLNVSFRFFISRIPQVVFVFELYASFQNEFDENIIYRLKNK